MTGSKQYYKPKQAEEVVTFVDFTPDWLVDCGPANGREAHVFKKHWHDISIIGLEPAPAMFEFAKKDYPGLLLNKAVWDFNGSTECWGIDMDRHSSIARAVGNKKSRSAEVECITIDTLSDVYGPFTSCILWMDIEGAETRALRGARELFGLGSIILANIEVVHGDDGNEDEITRIMRGYGLQLVHEYCHSDFHHDNIYRTTVPLVKDNTE